MFGQGIEFCFPPFSDHVLFGPCLAVYVATGKQFILVAKRHDLVVTLRLTQQIT